ncbi:MAG: hypothetical protein ACYS3S_16465, partial [Planctomycetota bacterium]
QARYKLALALAQQKQPGRAVAHYTKAVSIEPQIDTSPLLNHLLAAHYAQARAFDKATSHEEKALQLARAAGFETLAKEFEKWLKVYKQLSSSSQ